MSRRTILSVAATAVVAILCVATISTDAFAYRGGRAGVRVGAVGGGAYRGAVVRRGVPVGVGIGLGAAAVGAAAVGAAAVGGYGYGYGYPAYGYPAYRAPVYGVPVYGAPACGYYPLPPCY